MLRWLSNTSDSKKGNLDPIMRAWLRGKIIGRPKATERYTVEELVAMHMVGVYVEAENGD